MKQEPDAPRKEMRVASLQVSRSARYCVLGTPDQCRSLWTCIHGYGQLADTFIDEMSAIATSERALVAPEALSRFYLSGSRGSVGASWMTSRDRVNEIEDYTRYLDALRDEMVGARPVDDTRSHIAFGFSQGAATVTRWLAQTSRRTDAIVLWGGRVAHDIDEPGLDRLRSINRRYLVFGDADRYADETRIAEEVQRLNEHNLPFELIRFSGGHTIIPEVLASVAEQVEADLAD